MAVITGTIEIRHGKFSAIPTLQPYELGWATDTKMLYIGDGTNNYPIGGSGYTFSLPDISLATPTVDAHVVGTNAANDKNERYTIASMQSLLGWIPPNSYTIEQTKDSPNHKRVLNSNTISDVIFDSAVRRSESGGDVNTLSIVKAFGAYARTDGEDKLVSLIGLFSSGDGVNESGGMFVQTIHKGVQKTPIMVLSDGRVRFDESTNTSPTGAGSSILGYDDVNGLVRLTLNENQILSGNSSNEPRIYDVLGDVAQSKGVFTIGNNVVNFAKMQDIATDNIIGRFSSGTGDPELIACTAAGRALLDDASASAQRATLGLGDLAVQSKVSEAQLPTITYGEVIGTTYNITASGVYEATGITFTLPSAGTWSVAVSVRALINNSSTQATINIKLVNNASSSDVTNSQLFVARNAVASQNHNGAASRTFIITVSGATTFEIHAQRSSTGTYTTSQILSDSVGRTSVSYVRVGSN